MRDSHWTALLVFAFVSACQPQVSGSVAIVDGNQLRFVSTNEHTASRILVQAAISLSPADELLFNGHSVAPETSLPAADGGTLQIRRAARISVNGANRETSARTVGEAVAESGMALYAADRFSLPTSEFIDGALTVDYTPSREVMIKGSGQEVRARSAAATAGAALSMAGLPLMGLDISKPLETEAIPSDGIVQPIRVSEFVVFAEKSIPFGTKSVESQDVELGQEQILQPGLNGLKVSRVRIRYEDGQEVSRQTETDTVVRPAQDRIEARGTKIVLKTTTVNGVTFQYWREMQMYATVYSPCTSGGTKGCSSGTASGLPAGKGVVAVDPALYAYLNGQRLYIPGYGRAVIGDVGGGYIIEQNTGVSRYRWIDLGFDDNNIVDMTGWVTVYFLAPAPATIPDILK